MDAVFSDFGAYLTAFGYTISLFVVAAILSTVLGTLLAAFRVSPVAVLRWAGTGYVNLVRNTPLVIVFSTFSFMAPMLDSHLNFKWFRVEIGSLEYTSFYFTSVVALSLYTSAFVCEALRSGINAVPLGQAEAARAIGLPFIGAMRHVILPQAFRASVPPLASVQIALIKNTSVAAVFGVVDAVSRMGTTTNNFSSQRLGIFIMFALGYIVIVEAFAFLSYRLERRWRVA